MGIIKCIGCGEWIANNNKPCQTCGEIINRFCWQCHNRSHRYNLKIKYGLNYMGEPYYMGD